MGQINKNAKGKTLIKAFALKTRSTARTTAIPAHNFQDVKQFFILSPPLILTILRSVL